MAEETATLNVVTAAERQSLLCLEDAGPCEMLFEDVGEETVHGPTGYPHNPLLLRDKVV